VLSTSTTGTTVPSKPLRADRELEARLVSGEDDLLRPEVRHVDVLRLLRVPDDHRVDRDRGAERRGLASRRLRLDLTAVPAAVADQDDPRQRLVAQPELLQDGVEGVPDAGELPGRLEARDALAEVAPALVPVPARLAPQRAEILVERVDVQDEALPQRPEDSKRLVAEHAADEVEARRLLHPPAGRQVGGLAQGGGESRVGVAVREAHARRGVDEDDQVRANGPLKGGLRVGLEQHQHHRDDRAHAECAENALPARGGGLRLAPVHPPDEPDHEREQDHHDQPEVREASPPELGGRRVRREDERGTHADSLRS
jgi:hypothetical protein